MSEIINHADGIICVTTFNSSNYQITFYTEEMKEIKTLTVLIAPDILTFVSAGRYVYIVYINESNSSTTFYDIYAFETTLENIMASDEIINMKTIAPEKFPIEHHITYCSNKVNYFYYNGANDIAKVLIPTTFKDVLYVPFFEIRGGELTFVLPVTYDNIKYISMVCDLYFNRTGIYKQNKETMAMEKINPLE